MRALVVYESMYGNTWHIAEAICDGLEAGGIGSTVVPVDHAKPAQAHAVELLVIGGPTHAHGMTRPGTRSQALRDKKNSFPDPTTDRGLRDWMDDLGEGSGRPGAAFDTRLRGPKAFTGSAAKGIAQRLHGHGFALAGEPGSFLVTKENTLVPGEIERARAWARAIAVRLTKPTAATR